MIFRIAIDLFLEHLDTLQRSGKTIALYNEYLSRFDNHMTQKLNRPAYLDEVRPDDLERYLFEPPNDTNFSQSTRKIVITAFKSFYTFCYMKGYCEKNVGRQVASIPTQIKERVYITEDELLLLADQIQNETYRTLMLALFYTGMRIGEAVNLTFPDFHFDDGYIHIRNGKGYDRDIPISLKLRGILDEYMALREEADIDSDRVFADEDRKECSVSYFNLLLKKSAVKAGIKADISSHIMRHSFASNLIASGVDIVKVKKLLGHEKLETTQIYLHTNTHLLRSEIDRL